jgi:hypothetical protein
MKFSVIGNELVFIGVIVCVWGNTHYSSHK